MRSEFEHYGKYEIAKMYQGNVYGGTYQARERKEELKSFSAHSSSNITTEERIATRRLEKEARRKMKLSELSSSVEGLQRIQEDLLARAYSIFASEPLKNSR